MSCYLLATGLLHAVTTARGLLTAGGAAAPGGGGGSPALYLVKNVGLAGELGFKGVVLEVFFRGRFFWGLGFRKP